MRARARSSATGGRRDGGDGSFSSSDGRRVQVTAHRNQQARALPRYFDLGRGVTFYTWTSDQHSHYASRVVRTSLRDATYVLDGILDNQTELPISKHTTDTAGYSDLIFGLLLTDSRDGDGGVTLDGDGIVGNDRTT